MWAFVSPVQQAHAQSTYTPLQHLTQSQLTAVWWPWFYSIPAFASPVLDDTGANAHSTQPSPDLLFLCGTCIVTPGQDGRPVLQAERNITVKPGTALFVPVLNAEGDNVCVRPHLGDFGGNCLGLPAFPQGTVISVTELRALTAAMMDSATNLRVILTQPSGDKVPIIPARLKSPVFSFALPAPDNLYQALGVHVSGRVGPAGSDGYWVFLPGLLPGSYSKPEQYLCKLERPPDILLHAFAQDA